MNNLFLVEPTCCKSTRDVLSLFRIFGLQTGRYVVRLPNEWEERLQACFAQFKDVEKKALFRALTLANEKNVFVIPFKAIWNANASWLENADDYYESVQSIESIVVDGDQKSKVFHLTFEELLEKSPTAEERIKTTPSEFSRISEIFLKSSPEVYLVDPFFNPCFKRNEVVLHEILRGIKFGRCYAIKIFARNACDSPRSLTWEDVVKKLNAILSGFRPINKIQFDYILIDDHEQFEKMHERYLFSKSGGICVDQGLQNLPRDGKTSVRPISMEFVREYWDTYVFEYKKLNVKYRYSKKFDGVKWVNSPH